MATTPRAARVALALLLVAPTGLAAQATEPVPLSLAEAEARAVAFNPAARAAGHQADAAAHAAGAAVAFVWPGLEARAGVSSTDDPVGVFGTKLRQERFAASDLDVGLLNDPEAVDDWTAGFGARWQIADAARWAGLEAARSEARAADSGRLRTLEAVRFRARVLYVELLRALGQRDAANAAGAAATATLDRVERRRGEGMATDADVLQATAAVADARARIEGSSAAAGDAADLLAAHLGWAPGRVPVPTTALSEIVAAPASGRDASAWRGRADLAASEASVEGARQRVREATAARWPRAQLFAELGTHAPALGGDRTAHWSAGVQVSVPIFTGFALGRTADASRSAARAEEARHDGRVRQAAYEARSAERAVDAARRGREAALAAAAAADEATRLLRRRYEEGMTTLSELLRAEAEAARLGAAAIDADARLAVATATLDFALGATHDDPTAEGDNR